MSDNYSQSKNPKCLSKIGSSNRELTREGHSWSWLVQTDVHISEIKLESCRKELRIANFRRKSFPTTMELASRKFRGTSIMKKNISLHTRSRENLLTKASIHRTDNKGRKNERGIKSANSR